MKKSNEEIQIEALDELIDVLEKLAPEGFKDKNKPKAVTIQVMNLEEEDEEEDED